MDTPKKLTTLGTQDEDKQNNNKNTTQYVLDTTIRKQAKTTTRLVKPTPLQTVVEDYHPGETINQLL